MNGQGSNICIHNNKVCSLAPADRINVITSPRSAKAVEDATCGPRNTKSYTIAQRQARINEIVRWAEDQDKAAIRLCDLVERLVSARHNP